MLVSKVGGEGQERDQLHPPSNTRSKAAKIIPRDPITTTNLGKSRRGEIKVALEKETADIDPRLQLR
jgi:hypothetical protein